MKNFILIAFSFLLLALEIRSQQLVVNASEIGVMPGFSYIPDVAGKVLVDESLLNASRLFSTMGDIAVYPNWPVTQFGAVERGGVYGNMDNDPDLEVVYSIGQKTYAFNLNGTLVGGWPRILDYPADGAPAYGDIDGDGFGEIVVTTHQTATSATGTIYAFEKNGTNVYGFPVETEGGAVRTPVLADLDGDGADEIIVAIRLWPEGFIHVYRGDGTMYPNFPIRMDYAPGSAVAFGDVTGDGVPEIIAESYYSLFAFNTEGVVLTGFPYSPGNGRVFSYSTPVLADLDGDGRREIVCGDHSTSNGDGGVHVVKGDGTVLPGWPKYTSYWVYGPPSIGDVDGDGELDVIVGDQKLSTSADNKIYGWTGSTGIPLPGFPIGNVFGINSQIILADLDGDGMVELMADDNSSSNGIGRYRGFNHDGTEMEGWPLETQGTTFFINPMVLDINNNGILDISGGGTDNVTGNTNIYLWNANVAWDPDLAILPILQYNTRHNGVYGDHLMVGIETHGGTEAWGHGGWEIWPNPADSWITVCRRQPAFSHSEPAVISPQSEINYGMVDLSGKKVLGPVKSHSVPFSIDVSGLDPGFYILQITDGNGASASMKFSRISD